MWDQLNNDGYIKIVAVMQKFFDQAISGNWSYNPENYDNNEVPLSVMAKDMLNTYKYGWKTSYYQNTYDSKTDEDIEADAKDIISNDIYENIPLEDEEPMFFGEELNTQRYDEFKYPIFDKLTQTQLGYFWRPEEVSLQKDRNDYQSLDEGQKHIFTSNLK